MVCLEAPSTDTLKHGASFMEYVCRSHVFKFANTLGLLLNSTFPSSTIVCGLEKTSDVAGTGVRQGGVWPGESVLQLEYGAS